jgi:hypothetical protein
LIHHAVLLISFVVQNVHCGDSGDPLTAFPEQRLRAGAHSARTIALFNSGLGAIWYYESKGRRYCCLFLRRFSGAGASASGVPRKKKCTDLNGFCCCAAERVKEFSFFLRYYYHKFEKFSASRIKAILLDKNDKGQPMELWNKKNIGKVKPSLVTTGLLLYHN